MIDHKCTWGSESCEWKWMYFWTALGPDLNPNPQTLNKLGTTYLYKQVTFSVPCKYRTWVNCHLHWYHGNKPTGRGRLLPKVLTVLLRLKNTLFLGPRTFSSPEHSVVLQHSPDIWKKLSFTLQGKHQVYI
jgi:hypothetical protein